MAHMSQNGVSYYVRVGVFLRFEEYFRQFGNKVFDGWVGIKTIFRLTVDFSEKNNVSKLVNNNKNVCSSKEL